MAKLEFGNEAILSLESHVELLALEALNLNNVIEVFRDLVPRLGDKLKEVYKLVSEETDTVSESIKSAHSQLAIFKPKIQQASFINHAKTLVPVPEGFKGNLIAYIDTLNSMSSEIFNDANKILGEYNFALAAFISDKESKISLKDHTDIYRRVQHRREEMIKAITEFFPSSSNLSRAYLKDVIHRFADVEVLIDRIDTLDDARKKQNVKDVSASVKKSCDLLDIVIKNSYDQSLSNVSGAAAKNVAEGAYEIARYVEFVAVYRYRVEQAIVSVTKITEKLNEVVK
jgi:hypothetical protein